MARRIIILFGLLGTVAITFLPLGTWGKTYTGLGPLWGNEVLYWAVTLAVLLYVVAIERQPLSSIGFRRPRLLDLGLGAITGIVMLAGFFLIYTQLFPLLHLELNTGQLNKLLDTPLWYRVLLVTRAAVTEEVLYRGYGIERLQELTGSKWIAALITLAAFTFAHLSGWGVAQLLIAGFGGLMLTILYLWRRNLWANILAHWVTDGAGFLLS